MSSDVTTRTPQSRRERPAKPALTRQDIIDVALTILKDEGLNKVTMRRIAAAFDTGPASLYVYVKNTEDLHAQLLDALLETVRLDTLSGGTWQERLKELLTTYTYLLFNYPALARMALSTQPSGANYLSLVESVLALLTEGGVPDSEAAWAVDLLLLYATADAAEHGSRQGSPQAAAEMSALATAIANVDTVSYPHIARLQSDLLSGGPARFQWGLDVFLSGVLNIRRTDSERKS